MRPTSSVSKIPLLSATEFQIFGVLARQGPLTIRDIGHQLARQDLNFRQGYSSLGTLLQRMVKKGYVTKEDQQGSASKLYRPVLPYDLILSRQMEGFLDAFHLVSPGDLQLLIEIVQARLRSVSDLA